MVASGPPQLKKIVGKHILVPYDHWDYEDADAEEEPREAVSVRVTAWDGQANVFKVGSLIPALHLCYLSLCSFNALLTSSCQGVEDVDGKEDEFQAADILRFTTQSGITDEPTVSRLRHKRPREPIG